MNWYRIDLRILALLLLYSGMVSAQQQYEKKIDSLQKALVRYEADKKANPSRFGPMADTTKVFIYYSLAHNYSRIFSPLDEVYAKKSMALAEKINFREGIVMICNLMGVSAQSKSNYPLAMSYYKRGLKLSIALKDYQSQTDYYGNMGVLYARLSKYPEAIQCMMHSLQIAKQRNDYVGIAGGYNNIGIIYGEQGKYDDAIKNYLECLKVQEKEKDYYNICLTLQNIGDTYLTLKKTDQALSYLNKGLSIAIKYNNKECAALCYGGIGKLYLDKKNYDRALENFRTELKINQQIDNPYGISNASLHIAKAYFEKGEYQKAIAYIKETLPSIQKNGELDLTNMSYELLSKIYAASGNYKLALENQILFKQTADSIFNTEKEKKLTELQMGYDFKIIQDSTKAVQDKKDIIAKKEVQSQKTIKNSIAGGMSIVVIFLVIVMVQRNKIAVIRKQKALEEERNRISRELHDDLGAQLSTARMFMSSLKANNIPEDFTQTVNTSIELLDSSIADLRKIMGDMHTPILLEKGYLAATEILVNKVNMLHVIKFTLTHHKVDRIDDSNIEHQLYRITQELINNTLKYAQAKNVSIDVIKRDGSIFLMYEDDGIGYDLETVHRGNGLGNIEARAKSVGGTAEFDSMPGAGARTIIEIPLS